MTKYSDLYKTIHPRLALVSLGVLTEAKYEGQAEIETLQWGPKRTLFSRGVALMMALFAFKVFAKIDS